MTTNEAASHSDRRFHVPIFREQLPAGYARCINCRKIITIMDMVDNTCEEMSDADLA